MEEKNTAGRPTLYTKELRDRICRELASGKTLRAVCRMEDMPERPTIYDWYIHNKGEEKDQDGNIIEHGFSYHYDYAREIGLDEVADEIVEISDDGTNDFVEMQTKKGMKVLFDREAVLRSRLRVDSRQWYLMNMMPRKYGKNVKTSVQTLGKNGEPIDPAPAFDGGAVAAAVLAAIEKANGEGSDG